MDANELSPYLLKYGYEQGCFPMTMSGGEVEWFQPRVRALFPLSGMRVSRSLAKTIRRGVYETTFDAAFEQVMRGCLRPQDNWISERFIQVYTQAHFEGWGHSAEAWREGRLAGGVYGIALGSCFCAESMFAAEDDASKVALNALIGHCRELGFTVFDAQIMNPHLASLGAFEAPHSEYMKMLGDALKRSTPWS